MARITHVKRAQQRFETKPVLDENGEPKRTPVMRKVKDYETGEMTEVQKVTKRGREVFMAVTEPDKTRPKPNLRCDFRGCEIDGGEILPGTAYKHISPKSGPYGGRQLNRHAVHPNWNVWEYSSSMSARLAEIAHNFWQGLESGDIEDTDSVEGLLGEAADEIESLAEEKRESAQNIEDGFGHETEKSQELNDIADQLDDWAGEVRDAEIPEYPEPEEQDCEECDGTGKVDSDDMDSEGESIQEDCEECDGTGTITPEEPTDEQLQDWRDEVHDACSIVDESPV